MRQSHQLGSGREYRRGGTSMHVSYGTRYSDCATARQPHRGGHTKARFQRMLFCICASGLIASIASIGSFRPAAAQNVQQPEIKTLTLGLVAETDRPAVAAHFQDFVRYIAG